MKRSISLTAVIIFTSGCATVHDMNPFASNLGGLDADGDGVISQQEARTSDALSANFDDIDTNRSGGISPNEYKAANMQVAGLSFNEVDINRDGVISKREAEAMPISLKEAFGSVDADGDGNVSEEEYNAARVNLLKEVHFGDIDSDGDGVLDEQETKDTPALSESFKRVDTDEDGLVSEDEFKAAQR